MTSDEFDQLNEEVRLTFAAYRDRMESLAAQTQASVDQIASGMVQQLHMVENHIHRIEALELLNRTLLAIVLRQRRLSPTFVFDTISPASDNPIALEHARRILGARPRFQVIEGGKKDAGAAEALAEAAPAAGGEQ